MTQRPLGMAYRLLWSAAWLVLALSTAAPAAAQLVAPLNAPISEQLPTGWSATPKLDYAFVWDSNVLFENVGSTIVGDQLHIVRPGGTVRFVGRRNRFDANYVGSFVQHKQVASINSFDQRVSANFDRRLSRLTSWFVRHAAVTSPTTELEELVGVPFVRVGTRRQDVRSGVGLTLGRRTQASLAYHFQWVDFDRTPAFQNVLNGGQSHGASAGFDHALTRRLSLTGQYDMQRASVVDGSHFNLQAGWGGLEYAVSERLRVWGGGGFSHLSGVDNRPSRLGPSLRVGLSHQLERAVASVQYSRSYVPSYSFGGTSDNEELTGRLQFPIARRLIAQATVSLRRNEPLEVVDLSLRSLWFNGSIGYLLNDWLRIEGYSAATHQDIARPGGRINRYQLGLQLSAGTTTRIR